MGKKSKGKHRLDKFYHLAKEQGYRSRAAFKLVQLNRKYDFLSSTRTLLDLCAAPGGWLQVAAKTMPVGSLIVGVDLDPIRAIPGVTTMVGDITSQKTRQDLKRALGDAMAETVIHDGAPNVGGVWASEAYTQSALVLDALRLATEFLGPRGTFVTKIFRSQDYNSLLYAFKQLFEKVDATKPAASRNTSAEIFVVCQGYKAPTKIDPRLLDSKHLFKEVVEAPKQMGPDALLKDKFKATSQRQGYEEGVSLTRRTAPAAAFILSETPVEMLGRFTSFALEGPDSEAAPEAAEDGDVVGVLGYAALAAHLRTSPATDAEVRAACADLQVLGRSEFKALLKWRMQIKRELKAPAAKPEEPAEEAAEELDSEAEAEAREAAVLEEMQGVKESADRRLKKERKKRREARIKARIRAAQMAQGEGVNQDEGVPGESLFSLAQLRGRDAAAAVAEQEALEEAELDEIERDEAAARELVLPEASGNSSDDSADDRRYDAMTEDALEDAYTQYLNRQGQRDAAARRRARLQTKRKPGDVLGGEDEDGEDSGSDAEAAPHFDAPDASDSEDEGAGLLVSLNEGAPVGRATTDGAIAAQWFSQDVFADAPPLVAAAPEPTLQAAGAGAKGGAAAASKAGRKGAPGKQAQAAAAVAIGSDAEAPGTPPPGTAAEEPLRKAKQLKRAAGAPPSAAEVARAAAAKDAAGHGFEVVPRGRVASDSDASSDTDDEGRVANKAHPPPDAGESSDDEDQDFMDSLDAQGKAEVRALAQRMLRKRSRDELLEGAYNKYAFHDAGLPRWFAEDQRRHARAPVVLSKEEIDAQKAQLKAIDSRPIKKIAEAKARKKKRLSVSLEKARAKSEAVVGQEDVPMRSKMKEVEKIYARARAAAGQGSKSDKKKKAGTGRRRDEHKSKGRPLDRRMMSDKRQTNMKVKKAAAKKSKKGGGRGKSGGGGKAKGGGRR